MKHKLLFILLVISAIWMQSCKKKDSDDVTTTTTATPTLQAYINGTEWTPDTLSATITYNAAAKTKVLNLTGTKAQKRVTAVVTINNTISTDTIAAGTYKVDGTPNVQLTYYTQQKSSTGAYVFVPHGTVQPGSGYIIITSSSKALTGTFSFISTNTTYDSQGNITSIDIANISSGQFNNLPYANAQ